MIESRHAKFPKHQPTSVALKDLLVTGEKTPVWPPLGQHRRRPTLPKPPHPLAVPLAAAALGAGGGGGARLPKWQRVKEACSCNEAERRSRGGGRMRLVACGGGGSVRRGSKVLLGSADVHLPRRAAAVAGLGLDSFEACRCGSCVLGPGGLLWRWL
jgi:hypothetical protein